MVGIGGTAAALTITNVVGNSISLFSASHGASSFSVTGYTASFSGQNKLTVRLSIQNAGSSAHATNATVIVQNGSGDQLGASWQSSGLVDAGRSVTLSYVFQVSGIASSYHDGFVQLSDTA